MKTTDLIRPDIAEMEGYTPILPFDVLSKQLGLPPEAIIKLDANENPYGPSPKIYAALAAETNFHIYPDPGNTRLRAAMSTFLGVDAEMLMMGHGADELIDLIMRLFLAAGDGVLSCPPTFGMYEFGTAVNNGRFHTVPRRADFSVDITAVVQAVHRHQPKLLFITSPNNPDGSVITDAELQTLLALPTIVVLDEAYNAFSTTPSRFSWVTAYDNLMVLGTFSKWAGLAGLRVGYGAFPAALIPHLRKIKQPYNINVAGTTAALTSLADANYLMGNVKKIIAERGRLMAGLQTIPYLQPYPSQTNFILCRVIDRDTRQLKEQLAQKGILIRYFDKTGMRDHIRISVGRPEQSDRLLAELMVG